MKIAVVPDESARVTTVIVVAGKFTPGLIAAIRLSFQERIAPLKILAKSSPFNLSSPALTPSIFTTGTTPPIIAGN